MAERTLTLARPGSDLAVRSRGIAGRPTMEAERTARPLQRLVAARVIQPRLVVGADDDPFEREAERTAHAVSLSDRMPAQSGLDDRPLAGRLMRLVQGATGKAEPPTKKDDEQKKAQKAPSGQAGPNVAPAAIEAGVRAMSAAGGSPLAVPVRSMFESRFGYDFSDVRVHGGPEASGAAMSLGARAFTVGDHIFFGPGEFQPATPSGQRLIAHELTHTIQQKPGAARSARLLAAPKQLQRALSGIKATIAEKIRDFVTKDFPPWDLITLIIGYDPIRQVNVKGSTRDWIRAAMKLAPDGEALFDKLDKEGKVDAIAAWWDAEVAKLDLSYDRIVALVDRALDLVSAADVVDPIGAWNKKLKPVFAPVIKRVWDFIKAVGARVFQVVRDVVLKAVGTWAKEQKGYPLLTMALGKDPVTGEEVKPTLKGVIFAVLDLVDGGDKIKENLEKSKTIEKAATWFRTEFLKLKLTWEGIKALFSQAWDAFKVVDLLGPKLLLEKMWAIFGPPVTRLLDFLIAVARKILEFIFEGAMLIAGPIGLQIVNIVRKIGDTFNKIVEDPVAFVGHLVDAVKKGIQQFAKNIWEHLKTGLIEWLTGTLGEAGLVLPKVWDLRGILDLVLQILGITWPKVRAKLVAATSERTVSMLETAFGFIKTLVTEGPAAAWKEIVEAIGNLWDMVIGGVKDWAVTKIVTAAITKLATMLNPAGAVIQAIIATYNTIAFFIERIKQILAFVEAVVDSIANIAIGKIDAAANWVEKAMARTIPVILGFLARLIGLGDVSVAIKKVITAIQEKVDKAIDKVIKWVVDKAKSLFGGKADEKPGTTADITEPFAMHGAPHQIRGHIEGPAVKFSMASDGETDFAAKIADLRVIYTDPINTKSDPKRGTVIAARLDEISARLDKVPGLLAKAADAAAAAQIVRAEEVALKTMLSKLGDEFGIRGLRYTAPTHNFAPQGLDAYLRPTFVAGDPISRVSRAMPKSPASGDPSGIGLLPGYERGHLLADSLGGPGGDIRNLSPMSNLTNRGGGGMPRAEAAARQAIDNNPDPPTLLRYKVKPQYRDSAGLEQWAVSELGAAPNSANRLFVAVRNRALANADVQSALGGPTRLSLAAIEANRARILRQIAYHFLATGFDISIETIEGPAVPAPGFIPNHIGVTLP